MIRKLILLFVLFIPSICFATAPNIYYTDIISGPGTGGEDDKGCYLTIFGRDFGSEQGASTVTIGGGAVGAYKAWSDNKVSVQIGGSALDGAITLTTTEGASSAPESFDVRNGNLYFVSLSGDNENSGEICSYSDPCRTPNYIHDLDGFTAGDFIYIRSGTYDLDAGTEGVELSRWISVTVDGTQESPITFSGYPGETVTVQIDSSGYKAWDVPSSNYDTYYWVIANMNAVINSTTGNPFQFGWSSSDMRKVYGFRIINLDIQGGGNAESSASPFEMGRNQDCKVYGINVHDSALTGPSRTHFIYIGGEDVINLDLGWCSIHDCTYGRAALQVHSDGTWSESEKIDNVYIHNCRLYNLPAQAFLIDSRAEDIYFYNNVIYNSNQNSEYATSVISLRGDGDDSHTHPRLYNNTIYADGGTSDNGIFELGLSNSDCPGTVTLYNNIIYVIDSDEPYTYANYVNTINSDYNLWYGSVEAVPVWEGEHKVESNPNFTTPGSDFTIKDNSLARNAATDLHTIFTVDYINLTRSDWDIGAYEYGSSDPDTTAPTFSSASITTSGQTSEINWSEAVTDGGVDSGDINLDCSTAGDNIALTLVDGDGTSKWTLSHAQIYSDDTCTLDIEVAATEIVDASSNSLTGVTDQTISNGSTATLIGTTNKATGGAGGSATGGNGGSFIGI